ncbi:MAG: branched-chain amino acid transaminase [Anaerolineales bacterium]
MTLPNYAFFEGTIVPYSEAKIGIMNHTLNYGTGVFGGVRGYWNEEQGQLYVFRPLDHFKRLLDSAKLMVADLSYTKEELREAALELLRAEDYREDCYLRPLIYAADEIIGVRLHDLDNQVAMFAVPFSRYVERDEGAHVTFSAWRRIDDNMIPARGKITGAYVNSALIKTDAIRAGFDEGLVLTQEGHVSEGSAENIFMLRNGVLVTPPVTDNILEGITRRTVLTLAEQELDLPVKERPIDRSEVFLADELFMTGTAAQVTAITMVDYRPIGTGEMGPYTRRLRSLYADLVRGRLKDYLHWVEPVYIEQPEPVS